MQTTVSFYRPSFAYQAGVGALAAPVCFGAKRPATSSLDALDAVFRQTRYFVKEDVPGQPDTTFPMTRGWVHLPHELKTLLLPFVNETQPLQLQQAITTKKLGVLEESADVLHEALAIAAIEKGILNQPLIQRVKEEIYTSKRPISLRRSIQRIKRLIPGVQAQKFAEFSGLSKTDAKHYLTLVTLKYASIQKEGRFRDILGNTKTQFRSECEELQKRLSDLRDQQRVRAISRLADEPSDFASHLPALRRQLTRMLQGAVGTMTSTFTLMDFTWYKHCLRQGLRTAKINVPEMDYEQRKNVLKPYEALIEANLIHKTSRYRLPR